MTPEEFCMDQQEFLEIVERRFQAFAKSSRNKSKASGDYDMAFFVRFLENELNHFREQLEAMKKEIE